MQQLHRREIRSALSDEMKGLCEDYYDLRSAIVNFVRSTAPTNEYYNLIAAARDSYEATKDANPDNPLTGWHQRLQIMEKNGSWFFEQFMQFTGWFFSHF